MKLPLSGLHRLSSIPLTLEIACAGRPLSADLAQTRIDTAYHEAAHFTAAIACSAFVNLITVAVTTRRSGESGHVRGCETYPDEESFVLLAGHAWEDRFGDTIHSRLDYKYGFKPSRAYMLERACTFVSAHEAVIRSAAAGLLLLCTKDGALKGLRLRALKAWLKPQITPYVSQYKTGELARNEEW